MLQPGHPVGERLVDLYQLRDLRALAPHHDDQLVARHPLRLEHRKVEPHPDQSPVTDTPTSPTCHVTMLTHRSRTGLNGYRARAGTTTATATEFPVGVVGTDRRSLDSDRRTFACGLRPSSGRPSYS